jgi:GNAT superfamily N-acetyltransferase
MTRVLFLDDPGEFLDVAGERLAADPVLSMVVTRVTTRARDEDALGVPRPDGVPRWWAVLVDGEEVEGLAMRTAPFAPFPPYLLPMEEHAAVALARQLHSQGESVEGANGALPAVRIFAEETARLTGGTAEVGIHMRLFELGHLVSPGDVPGELRQVRADEIDLALHWLELFMADADEMAGRPRGTSPHEAPSREDLARRIDSGSYWFWVDRGRPVNLTVGSAPAFGVSGIGPVFTPVESRGRGYASAAVAAVSRLLLDRGARVCLFTDQANPTSNRIYQRLGFEPVTDTANMVIRS